MQNRHINKMLNPNVLISLISHNIQSHHVSSAGGAIITAQVVFGFICWHS